MTDEELMGEALKEARIAFDEGEVPVGAVVVLDGRIIGRGHNERERKLDVSSHAEIEAIKDAERNLGRWTLDGAAIYVTLEPCLMCAAAISQARIFRLVYGADDPTMGAVASHHFVYGDPSLQSRPLVTSGVRKEECSALLERFFKERR
jgi:tRNA(adenine34) deaminase